MRNESGNIVDYTHELINNKSKTIRRRGGLLVDDTHDLV